MSRSRQWHSRRSRRRFFIDIETADGPTLRIGGSKTTSPPIPVPMIMTRQQWNAFVGEREIRTTPALPPLTAEQVDAFAADPHKAAFDLLHQSTDLRAELRDRQENATPEGPSEPS